MHSFTKKILEENEFESGISIARGIILDYGKLVWLRKNIFNFGIKYLEIGHNVNTLIKDIMTSISNLKNDFTLPEDLSNYCNKKLKTKLSEEQKKSAAKRAKIHGFIQ